MKKIVFLLFFALLMQKSYSQSIWDSIGSGLPNPSGAHRAWNLSNRLFASTPTNPNLYKYTGPIGGWSQIISSSQGGQILDLVFDSINNQLIIVGKYGDLIGPMNSGVYTGIAKLDLYTGIISSFGIGINYPAEYIYKASIINGQLLFAGRFQIIVNGDTIDNVAMADLQTESYSKVGPGKAGDLVRDVALYQGDIILAGSFLRDGIEYPLGKITPLGLDLSVSGLYRGFGYSITELSGSLIVGGNINDTIGNSHLIVSWNGNNFSTLGTVNGLVNHVSAFKDDLYIGGSFDTISDLSGITLVHNLARLHTGVWDDVLGGCSGTGLSVIKHLAPFGDTLYVSGSFDHAGSVSALNIARLISPTSTTSVLEYDTNTLEVLVYPNPTTDGTITISTSNSTFDSLMFFEVFDVAGKKVKEFSTKVPSVVRLELSNGLYFLKTKEKVTKLVVRQ